MCNLNNISLISDNYCQSKSKIRDFLSFKEHYILYLLFFSFGFNKSILYIPILCLMYFVKLPKLHNLKVKKTFIILFFMYLFFLISILFIGYDRLTIESPVKYIFAIIIPILFGGLFFQYQDYKIKLNLIGFYLFGLFFDSFAIVAYSYLSDSILYGYGRLISPFTKEELNSPGHSNMLAITLSYFYFMAVYYKDNIFIKLSAILIVFLTLFSGVFLGGRAFFVILLLIILMYFVSQFHIKKVLYSIISLIGIVSIFVYVASINELLQYYLEFTLNRFENALESNRFLHYLHGLNMLFEYPFGGFGIDTLIENTKWFHNIFLDSARVAGWIPILFFLAALIYTSKFLLYKKNNREDITIPFIITIVVFLIMQQDVVIEGQARSIIILFFSTYMLIDSKLSKMK